MISCVLRWVICILQKEASMNKIYQTIKNLSDEKKFSFLFIIISQFIVLFNYSIIRSLAGTMFAMSVGVKDRPLAGFVAFFVILVCVSIINQLQKKISVQKIFAGISLFTFVAMASAYFFFKYSPAFSAYFINIVQHAYIVFLIHLIIGYSNEIFSLDEKKLLYGTMGAIASVGSVLGGLLTSEISSILGSFPALHLGVANFFYGPLIPFNKEDSSHFLFVITLFFYLLPVVFFLQSKIKNPIEASFTGEQEKKPSPFSSLKGVWGYVLLIALLISLTQFLILFADQKFFLTLSEKALSADAMTSYQGRMYSMINGCSLLIQVLILPWLFNYFHTFSIHYAIPVLNMIPVLLSYVGISPLLVSSVGFIESKGVDYSLFAVAKELLYHPLKVDQRYGAKYIVDIVAYRGAKGLSGPILYYFQNLGMSFLNYSMLFFLFLWIMVIYFLQKLHQRFKTTEEI